MPNAPEGIAADPLAAVRAATRELHAEAERAGFVRELLAGRATRSGYALWLRNLWPAYDALERALATAPGGSPLAALADRRVMRAAQLEQDLEALAGAHWRGTLAAVPAADAYARRIRDAARTSVPRLAAHAYVRYLGDLNGGRVLRRIVSGTLGLDHTALRFYAFDADAATLEASYRAALRRTIASALDSGAAAEEATIAFRLNIEVAEAVLAAIR
jgi:heme oxygenase